MSSDETKLVYRQLEEWSSQKKVLKNYQMSRLTRMFLKRLLPKMGIRPQVYGDPFTRQKFWDAILADWASFPYVRADRGGLNPEDIHHDLDDDGVGLYIRRNPHQEDPGDDLDPRQREDFELHKGIAVGIEHQKVVSYTIWLWFNQIDTCYLRIYESIAARFLLANRFNLLPDGTIDPESPYALPLHIVFISIRDRLEKGYLKRTMRTCTIVRKEEKRKMKGSDATRKKGGS